MKTLTQGPIDVLLVSLFLTLNNIGKRHWVLKLVNTWQSNACLNLEKN